MNLKQSVSTFITHKMEYYTRLLVPIAPIYQG